MVMVEAFGHKPRFISFHRTIWITLDTEHLLTTDNVLGRRRGNKGPCIVFQQWIDFGGHGSAPLLVFRSLRITSRFQTDVLTDDVADIAIGLALAVLRRLCESDRYVRSGMWKKGDYKLTTKFTGKTVGVIGLGRIGKAIAKRAEAFSCPIAYFSRTEKPELKYKYYPTVVELASKCDVLVVACALTEETRHIINREVIDALGPKGVLINIGRGHHVDEPELVSALLEGRLGGAGLDVYQNEPEVPEQLFGLENVVLLPHAGSGTTETRCAMADLVIANLEAHFLNKPLLTPVV